MARTRIHNVDVIRKSLFIFLSDFWFIHHHHQDTKTHADSIALHNSLLYSIFALCAPAEWHSFTRLKYKFPFHFPGTKILCFSLSRNPRVGWYSDLIQAGASATATVIQVVWGWWFTNPGTLFPIYYTTLALQLPEDFHGASGVQAFAR